MKVCPARAYADKQGLVQKTDDRLQTAWRLVSYTQTETAQHIMMCVLAVAASLTLLLPFSTSPVVRLCAARNNMVWLTTQGK